jgi:uncharacterized membrane protein YfbV (UPF0208 family)
MSLSTAKKVIRYHRFVLAFVNAGITWVILIIAPLGLFAVITCTVAVFLSSLGVGWVCDRAILSLLASNSYDVITARRELENFENRAAYSSNMQAFPREELRRNLPEQF